MKLTTCVLMPSERVECKVVMILIALQAIEAKGYSAIIQTSERSMQSVYRCSAKSSRDLKDKPDPGGDEREMSRTYASNDGLETVRVDNLRTVYLCVARSTLPLRRGGLLAVREDLSLADLEITSEFS